MKVFVIKFMIPSRPKTKSSNIFSKRNPAEPQTISVQISWFGYCKPVSFPSCLYQQVGPERGLYILWIIL